MCDLLDEMVNKGIKIGKKEGVKVLISTCREWGISFDETAAKVKEKFCLGDEEAGNSMKLYW